MQINQAAEEHFARPHARSKAHELALCVHDRRILPDRRRKMMQAAAAAAVCGGSPVLPSSTVDPATNDAPLEFAARIKTTVAPEGLGEIDAYAPVTQGVPANAFVVRSGQLPNVSMNPTGARFLESPCKSRTI